MSRAVQMYRCTCYQYPKVSSKVTGWTVDTSSGCRCQIFRFINYIHIAKFYCKMSLQRKVMIFYKQKSAIKVMRCIQVPHAERSWVWMYTVPLYKWAMFGAMCRNRVRLTFVPLKHVRTSRGKKRTLNIFITPVQRLLLLSHLITAIKQTWRWTPSEYTKLCLDLELYRNIKQFHAIFRSSI